MHYAVVDYPDDVDEFVRRVNIFARYGWTPLGGMTATYLPEFDGEPPAVIFAQAMTNAATEPTMPVFQDEEGADGQPLDDEKADDETTIH